MRRWVFQAGVALALGVGLAIATAFYEVWLTLPSFQPIQIELDFGYRKVMPHLKQGFSVTPSLRYANVIHVRNRESEALVQLPGLPTQRYLLRFKARFPTTHHQITLYLNDHPLGVATPQRDIVAQKFKFSVDPAFVRPEINLVRFVHEGVQASVDYEQLEIRNYRFSSESGSFRLYFDGPWIQESVRQGFPRHFARSIRRWAVFYVVTVLVILGVVGVWLRLPLALTMKVVLGNLLAALMAQSVCCAASVMSPFTIWMTPACFSIFIVLVTIVVCVALALPVAWRLLRLTAWYSWVSARLAAHHARTHAKGIVWIGILVWQTISLVGRWMWQDVAGRAFALFVALYVAGALCMSIRWREGAEGVVNWAFGFLIVAVAAFGWRAIKAARTHA